MTPEFDVAQTPLARGTTLIEASAGTGKTYAIAGLFLRLVVEEGLTVGQILVTTYTVPATAELRARIRNLLKLALADWPRGGSSHELIQALITAGRVDPAVAERRLETALRAFDEAAIHTIHAICQRVLQDRALESGMLFDTELITDQSAVLRELAEDYWRTHFYPAAPALVAAAMSEKIAPDSLAHLLKETTQHPVLEIRPQLEIAEVKDALEAGFAELARLWPAWGDEVRAIFAAAKDWAKGDSAKWEKVEPHFALLDRLAADPSPPREVCDAIDAFAASQIAEDTKAKGVTPSHPLFDLCQRFAATRRQFAAATRVHFLGWARAELPRRKARRNVVSFDDLLTQLHRALSAPDGPRLAGLVRQRFRAALIDEFQDTDPTQDAIFRLLFRGDDHWLFLIGDPKQAIYGFRGADVFSYLAAAGRADRSFRLGKNHRSAEHLVGAVNAIFERSAHPFVVPGIDFAAVGFAGKTDEKPIRHDGAARPPFRFLLAAPDQPLTVTHANRQLPRVVAAEAARLLAGGVTIGGKPLQPRDIAVLTASNRQAQNVQSAFAAQGIPSVLMSNGNVFASPEAGELHTLLAAIAEPAREGLIRSALATSLLGQTAAEIDALSLSEREWEACLLRFQRWNARWREIGFIQMFRPLLGTAGVRIRLLGAPQGERALTNLLHLAELVNGASIEQRLAPAALLHWLAEQRRAGAATAEEHELRLERDEDAAKIITVHKSKGLEFNVVICPFAWGKAELRGAENPLFHSAEASPVLDLGSDEMETSARNAGLERLAEHARLLYVALTRARHECHVAWGRFNGSESSAAMWVLHPPPPHDDPVAALAAHGKALTAEALTVEIGALAASHPEAIAAVPMPAEDAPPHRSGADTAAPLQARIFNGRIDRLWRVSSFTSLTQHRDAEQADYDRAPAGGETADTGVPGQGIHAFPAGKNVGVCLHAIFEKLDFTRSEMIEPLVEQQLRAFAFDAELWTAPVSDCVRKVLAAELAPGLRLGGIPPAQRLEELEFHFPVERLEAETISALLADVGGGRLSFDARRGLLRGVIDLVFEHAGKVFIVDWKSNRLGTSSEAYDQPALHAEMARHHYGLQAHLYAVALRRYLRLRLGSKYDEARHFGGVFYLFIRGVDPARPELGVVRAPLPRLVEFDALLSSTS